MKSAPAPLIGLINASSRFYCVDLYDVFLVNGDNLRLADSDRPVEYPATGTVLPPGTFLPAIGFKRSGVQWSSEPTAQSLTVTLIINDAVTYATLLPGSLVTKPVAQLALEGIFDGARVTIYRAFFDTETGAMVDALLHYDGTVADVIPTSSNIEVTIKSELDKLNIKLPLNLFQPMCAHAFLDQGCDPNPPGTLRTANTSTGALVGTPTAFIVGISGNFAANNWQLGVLKMTSGTCTGQRRAIRSDVDSGGNHNLTLSVPLPEAPLAGDTYSLTTGCDRKFTTCVTRYNNAKRFRGFPYVPQPEDTRL